MPNDFVIEFKPQASGNQIAAVERALDDIGPGPVEQEDGYFIATLEWGTNRASLGNLKGRLNRAANIVVDVHVYEATVVLEAGSTLWNMAFTNLIRQTTATAWGNWALNPAIVPGAVGILSPTTGSFTPVAILPNADVLTLTAPDSWEIESSAVHKTESEVQFKGGYKDPSSGTTVDVGLDVAWSFASEGSIASSAAVTGRASLNDFGVALATNFDWLLERARSVNHASKDGILQGFGVITHVTLCAGGINIGSLNEQSSFSLVGSVDGVNAMTGGGEVSANVKGSYKETNQTKAFESHMWPRQADTAAPGDLAIAFQFATFNGRTIMPTWTHQLSGLGVAFDNAHGGTYIGRCRVEYATSASPTRQSQSTSVPGGQVRAISLPLDAIDVEITVDFAAGDTFNFVEPAPLAKWLTGQCTIDMGGVWPWSSTAKIRD